MIKTPYQIWSETLENAECELNQLLDERAGMRLRMDEQGFDGDFDPTDPLDEAIVAQRLIIDGLYAVEPEAEDDEKDDEEEYVETRADRHTRLAESGYFEAHEPLHAED